MMSIMPNRFVILSLISNIETVSFFSQNMVTGLIEGALLFVLAWTDGGVITLSELCLMNTVATSFNNQKEGESTTKPFH